ETETWWRLQAMRFDIMMNIDKAQRSCALANFVNSGVKLGYGLDSHGNIIPLNREAEYNYRLCMDDNLKFRVNQKPNTQLLAEAMGLKYARDEYILSLSPEELAYCAGYKERMGLSPVFVQPQNSRNG